MPISAIAEPAVTIAPPKADGPAMTKTTVWAAETVWEKTVSANAERPAKAAAPCVHNAAMDVDAVPVLSAKGAAVVITATCTNAATVTPAAATAAGSAKTASVNAMNVRMVKNARSVTYAPTAKGKNVRAVCGVSNAQKASALSAVQNVQSVIQSST